MALLFKRLLHDTLPPQSTIWLSKAEVTECVARMDVYSAIRVIGVGIAGEEEVLLGR